MTLGAAESYAAIRSAVVGTTGRLDAVVVRGPDARSYLQGQCSQDLDGMVVGEARESLLLSPQGKLDAYVRVLCSDADELTVLVELGFGEAVLERLRRFKLRVKAELDASELSVVALRGPLAREAEGERRLLRVDWPGFVGVDLLGRDTMPADVDEGDAGAFEAARIEAGQPVMGRELTERTIAPEAGIVTRTVSFTKGCFTGQELVARLDARGNNVPRHLRGIVFADGESLAPGDVLLREEKEVGALTSVAYSPGLGAFVALGYVRREIDPPAPVECRDVNGALWRGEVRELPLFRD